MAVLPVSPAGAISTSPGDGLTAYGVAANTTPQWRTYANGSNTFGSASGAVAGGTGSAYMMRTSPTKQEAIAGYVTSGGTLYVMCYDGSTWTNEWNVSVGGTGSTRRFDIAYETASGDVMVTYSSNAGSTNELSYRTKAGSTGCATANWSSATTLDPVRTSGVVHWVKMVSDHRASSNLITAIWADANSDLSAMVWSGTAWSNEPSSALETALQVHSASQDIEDFDLAYESLSGDLMVMWSTSSVIKYATCTGGTSACTWGSATTAPDAPSDAKNISLSPNPISDQIVWAAISNASTMEAGHWTGNTWQNVATSLDGSAGTVIAGKDEVSTGWLVSGGLARSVIVYTDTTAASVGWYVSDGTDFTFTNDGSGTLNFSGYPNWLDIQTDLITRDRIMLSVVDGSNLYLKRLVMASNGTFTWSNADGGSAATASLAQSYPSSSAFAFWSNKPIQTQAKYRWYANANSSTPGSANAAENTSYNAPTGSAVRLRSQIGVTGNNLAASSQDYSLQYATSTSGPWASVGAKWWNASWLSRRKITFDNSTSNANLADFPLLVSLSAANIDYSKTQNSGQDIRFVDDDGTSLSYEIEKWDETGTSSVWVKVPQIDGGSSSDSIWMYYDNGAATDGQSVTSTWNSDIVMAQHFEETAACATTFTDSTALGNDGTCVNSSTAGTGKIGGGRNFVNSSNQSVSIPDTPSLSPTSSITASGWFNQTSLATDQTLMGKWSWSAGATNGPWVIQTSSSDSTRLRLLIADSPTDGGNVYADTPAGSWSTGWHHVAFTFSGAGSSNAERAKIYIDGVLQTLTFPGSAVGASLVDSAGPLFIGTFDQLGRYWDGEADEVEIDDTTRPQGWIVAQYKSQSGLFNTFGSEEAYATGGWRFYDNASPAHGATVGSTLLTGSNIAESYQERNPSATNPNAITAGQSGEWDFALDPAAATAGTTYYMRMAMRDGAALDTYSVYPTLRAGSTLGFGAYRFFANANSADVGAALAPQDTVANAPTQGTPFRLRTLINVINQQYDIGAGAIKLQYAARSGTCDTAFSGETYVDVATGSGAIRYYNNASPADGAAATSNVNDPTSGNTKVMQSYEEANDATTIAAIPIGQDGEWDFSLVDFSAAAATPYCFRVVRSDDTLLDSYTTIPQITTYFSNTAPSNPSSLGQYKSNGTTAIPGTTHYTYDSTTAGSLDANGGTLSVSNAIKRNGAGSMKDVSSATSMFINDGQINTRDLSGYGNTLSAWVYVPAANDGAGWFAYLAVYDSTYAAYTAPPIFIPRNTWTLLTYSPPKSVLQNTTFLVAAIGGGAGASNTVYVDDFGQGSGIWTNETSVTLKATVADVDNPDSDSFCVEVQPIATPFANTDTACGSLVGYSGSGVSASVSVTGLSTNTQYHWQARTKDTGGLYSSWVSFGSNSESTPDFGVDTTNPVVTAVYDGSSVGVESLFNNGSLSSLAANWSGSDTSGSGIVAYECAIGTTAGASDVLGWTDNYTATSAAPTGLTLRTDQNYYVSVRAIDTATNVSTTVTTSGQQVAPTLTFSLNAGALTLDNITLATGYTASDTLTLTTSTNAYGGYQISQYAMSTAGGGLANSNGPQTIPAYGSSYAAPTTWTGTGFGYTSSDTNVLSSGDIFGAGTKYAALAASGPGDVIADHAGSITGTPISGESFTVTFKVTTTAMQMAGRYSTTVVYSCVATY